MTVVTVQHLPAVVPAEDPEPDDIGTGHPMREVTELLAASPDAWTPELAEHVAAFFDELAPGWAEERSARSDVLVDALRRGLGPEPPDPLVVELGAGTGAGTRALLDRFERVVAVDISDGMLRRMAAAGASRVLGDARRMPVPDGAVDVLVCVNMFLFADEVRRVLAPDGSFVWANSIGDRTPIYLPAERVVEALGPGFTGVASTAGWGSWCVAARSTSTRV